MLSRMTKAQRTIFACCVLAFDTVCPFVALTAWGLATEFGSVQIVVTDQNDVPIPNVNLCLAMPGQSAQKVTDQNGRYNTALPVGTTTVRTSRNGFANAQETFTISNGATLVRQIKLQPGQSTPLPSFCGGIAGTTSPGNSCPSIANVQVEGGAKHTDRNIRMEILFDAGVQYYRIVEFTDEERYPETQFNPDMAILKKNVQWIPLTSTTHQVTSFFPIHPRYGTHVIYVQASGPLQGCVSPTRGISVILEPAKLQTYELDKKDILRFLNAANSRGYQFRSHFEFIKKHRGYCVGNAMVEPNKPNSDARTSNTPLEEIAASFEVFIGPDLKPFWELRDIEGSFPGLPPFDFNKNRIYGSSPKPNEVVNAFPLPYPSMAFTKYSEVSCPYCRPQALTRMLSWRRLVYPFVTTGHLENSNTNCVTPPDLTRPDQQPSIVKLTLRGPAGEDPINALGDLRSNTFQTMQPLPPPRIIVPRSIDEETRQGEPADAPAEPEKTP